MKFPETKTKNSYNSWLISSCLIILAFTVFIIQFFPYSNEVLESEEVYKPKVLGTTTDFRAIITPNQQTTRLSIDPNNPNLTDISAKAYLVYILNENENLISKNPDIALSIASLTKLMTGLVAYENLKFTDFAIINNGLTDVKPIAGLKKGIKYKIEDLFNSMIIGSANDSGEALAKLVELTTKKPFSDLMNKTAEKVSLTHSHFSNPIGFDSVQNYSTANDLKKLVNYTQKIYAFSSLGKRNIYEFRDENNNLYQVNSTNKLLKYPEISSIKTGYTNNSLGSMIIKENIFGKDVIFIVLGSQNRESDIEKLRKSVYGGEFSLK